MNKRIVLVDISTIFHRIRLTKQDKSYGVELLSTLDKLKKEFSTDRIIFIQDFGGSRYRKELTDTYKAHRTNKEMSAEEENKLAIMREWNSNLHLFHPLIESYKIFGIESDDIISILFWELKKMGYDTIVCSQDKDYLGSIPLDNFYNIIKERFYTEEDRKGLTRNQFKLWQGIVGDVSDNVAGIAGEKTSIILCNNFGSYKEMKDFNGDVNSLTGVTPHTRRHILKALELLKTNEGWGRLKLSYALTNIFTNTSKLNETELEEYEKMLEKILSFDVGQDFVISPELEDFLENVKEGEVILLLEDMI